MASGRSSIRCGRVLLPRREGRREGCGRDRPSPASPAAAGECSRSLHPAFARSGTWLSTGCGRRTLSEPSFTLSRSTSRATSRSLDGSSTRLSCAADKSSPSSRPARRHRSRSRDRAPPPCRRAADGDASGSRLGMAVATAGDGDASVDPEAGQRQPPRTQLPPLKLLDEVGDQPLERLGRSLGMRRRLFQPEQGARRPARCGTAVSGSGLRPSARSSASTGLSASRNRRASSRRSIPASVPMVFSPSRSRVRVASGGNRSAATGRAASFAPVSSAADHRRGMAVMRQRPGGRGRRRHGYAGRQAGQANRVCMSATSLRSPPNRCATPLTSSRSAFVAVHFDQRRPAPGPARQPFDQAPLASGIGRHCDQRWIERAGIGQAGTRARAAFAAARVTA